jgi:hypothetical protein
MSLADISDYRHTPRSPRANVECKRSRIPVMRQGRVVAEVQEKSGKCKRCGFREWAEFAKYSDWTNPTTATFLYSYNSCDRCRRCKEREPGDSVAGTVAREQPQLRIKFHSLPARVAAYGRNRLVRSKSDISWLASLLSFYDGGHPADSSSCHKKP